MDKRMFMLFASSLLSTLRVESAKSGTVYAAFMSKGITYDQYMTLLGALMANDLITTTNNTLSLTPKGQEMAKRIDLAIT